MNEPTSHRHLTLTLLISLTAIAGMIGILCVGAVEIPVDEVWAAISGYGEVSPTRKFIVMQSRLPMGITALLCGASLSVAGLIMQTTFENPLAGPSVLGVSSGASLGVALFTLAATVIHLPILSGLSGTIASIVGSLAGAAGVIIALLAFSRMMHGNLSLLIAGIMISYLTSSIISLLNFFAPAEGVKQFVMWGLGNFGGVTLQMLGLLSPFLTLLLVASVAFAKPLNALLTGERYASNMGYDIRHLRTWLLAISGILTALVTAFCGPIGFIGLVVPHLSRILYRTSNHNILIPATMLCGAALTLVCALISVLPLSAGVIPVNAITPLFGVPIIIYLLLHRDRLPYFN